MVRKASLPAESSSLWLDQVHEGSRRVEDAIPSSFEAMLLSLEILPSSNTLEGICWFAYNPFIARIAEAGFKSPLVLR